MIMRNKCLVWMSKSRDSVVVSVSQSQKGYVCFDKKGCLKAETFDTSGGIFDMFSSTKTSLINFPLPLIKDEEAHKFAVQSLKLD